MSIIIRTIHNNTLRAIQLFVPGYDTVKPPVIIPSTTTVDLFTVLTGDELQAAQPVIQTFVDNGDFTVVATVDTDVFNPVGGTVATPGGANMDVQFNDLLTFGGSSNFTWDNINQILSVIGMLSVSGSFSTDGGAISSNGSGNLTINGNLATSGTSNFGSNGVRIDGPSGDMNVGGNIELSGNGTSGNRTLYWADGSGNIMGIAAPSLILSPYNLFWPTTQGAVSTFLQNDGLGNLSWGSVNPAGSNTDVQFNNAGVFGGNPSFTFDGTFLDTPNLRTPTIYAHAGLQLISNQDTLSRPYLSIGVPGQANGGLFANMTGANQLLLGSDAYQTGSPSALLELNSSTQGFLPPQMNTASMNAIASPAVGLLVYNTDVNFLQEWNGTIWTNVAPSLPAGVNGDLQFNNSGVFGGATGLTTDGVQTLFITGTEPELNMRTSGTAYIQIQSLDGSQNYGALSANASSGLILYPNSGAINWVFDNSGVLTTPGDVNLNTHQIHNVVDPTAPQDAATKNYVDTHETVPGGSSSQLQYNNAGAFAGAPGLTTDGTTLTATNVTINSELILNASLPAFIEYTIPTGNSQPTAITAGPDGNVWFIESNTNKIAKVTPTGTFTEYSLGALTSNGYGICAGPDGNVWFCTNQNKIAKITPTGTITSYTVSTATSVICLGPDGNLWYSDGSQTIGKITPSGVSTPYLTSLDSGSYIQGICTGSDGRLWVTTYGPSNGMHLNGAMTTSGVFSSYGNGSYILGGICLGPDGNVWYTDQDPYYNYIAAMSTSGVVVAEYTIPTLGGASNFICKDNSGNLWFVEQSGNNVAKSTTSGVITEYAIPTPSASPIGICLGPDGNIWFTENGTNKIGKVVNGFVEIVAPATVTSPYTLKLPPAQGAANTFLKDDGAGNLSFSSVSLTASVSGILPVANGGTGTATPGLIAGTHITSITGAWPNQTINAATQVTPPAGANTDIQFNNAGAFGASASLTWNGSILTASSLSSTHLTITGNNNGINVGQNGFIQFFDNAQTNFATIQAAAVMTGNTEWFLPAGFPTTNQVLTAASIVGNAVNLSWTTPPVTAPAGSNGNVQFNNGGVFGGAATVNIGVGGLHISSTDALYLEGGGSVAELATIAGVSLFTASDALRLVSNTNATPQTWNFNTDGSLSVPGQIHNVVDPTAPQDAATKNYVDTNEVTPGGADTQIQFNNAGAFGGISSFTTDGTNLTLNPGWLNVGTFIPAPVGAGGIGSKFVATGAIDFYDANNNLVASIGHTPNATATTLVTDLGNGTPSHYWLGDATDYLAQPNGPSLFVQGNGKWNVGIFDNTPDNSAALAIGGQHPNGNYVGFLPPTMTSTQRDAIATPAEGLMIYNTTDHQWEGWNGTAWAILG